MKKLSRGAQHCQGNDFAPTNQFKTTRYDAIIVVGSLIILMAFLFSGCTKESKASTDLQVQAKTEMTQNSESNVLNDYNGLSPQTLWELQQARAHTAKYRDIRNAMKDGYSDISVVVPNMGHHFMKMALVDGNFEFRSPEILVYNKEENGDFTLVAVEYAIPIDLTPNNAPEGFTGSADVWDHNTGFGLWLLHAWVWSFNPAGVFNPTNPLIHVH